MPISRISVLLSIVFLCGFAPAILGFVVLFGWYTENVTLIQVSPAFVPMQFNTALGFLVGGLGLIAILARPVAPIYLLGGLTGLIGGLTLLQYISGLSFGIDQLIMEHYITVKTSHPGRMAPNTALCFTLSGIALLTVIFKFHRISADTICGIAGSLVFGLGLIAFTGYTLGLETAYGWGHLTRMAVHTSAGFIVLGIGTTVFAISLAAKSRQPLVWFPTATGILILTITASLWQALSSDGAVKFAQHFVLFFGAVLSVAFALMLHLLRATRRGQAALVRAHDELEAKVALRTKELANSQAEMRLALDNLPGGLCMLDAALTIQLANDRFFEILGITVPDRKSGTTLKDAMAGSERIIAERIAAGTQEGAVAFTHRMADGMIIQIRLRPIDDGGVVVTVTDITERTRAQEQFQQSEEQFVPILQSAPVGVSVTNSKSERVIVNQRYADIVGMSLEDLAGSKTMNVWTRQEDRDAYAQAFAENGEVVDMEFEMRRNDGSTAWVMANAIALDFYDEPVRVNWIVELTNRREAEVELRESQAQLTRILDQSPYGVSIVSRRTRERLYVNQGTKEMLGLPDETNVLQEDPAASFVDPDKLEANWALFERQGYITREEEERRRYDGSSIWCLVDWRQVTFDNQEAVMVWAYDITERKAAAEELERALRQAEQFNRLTVNRELRMVEMKEEIDTLLIQRGDKPRYVEELS